ncbi:MAG: class I tRNA ligase family protein, partial [Deltaproteobacteria bacterium]|nr:class I tRNA ligase family protein [Deltaproteobacteria bacterium]
LIDNVTAALDRYEIADACKEVYDFLKALNNWYIRRSRDRFWKQEKDQDKQDAYDTLHTVLCTFTKVAAPLLPMITEEIYRGLTGEESVHLSDWPDAAQFPSDHDLVSAMDTVRDVCSAGLSLREAHQLRTRLPLRKITVAGKEASRLAPYSALVRDELNVKEVSFSDEISQFADFQLHVNARELGPKLGASVKEVITASKSGNWRVVEGGKVEAAGKMLSEGEFTLRLVPKPGVASQALPGNAAVVVLDTEVTKELADEGIARDLVRLVQQARKDAGLHVADQIKLTLDLPEGVSAVVKSYTGYIAEQTLSREIIFGTADGGAFLQTGQLDGSEVSFALNKV